MLATNVKEDARETFRNGILNDMTIEKLIELTNVELYGNVCVFTGINESNHYFNKMEHILADDDQAVDLLSYSFYAESGGLLANTSFAVYEIENIAGSINEDNPDNVLDVNITLTDGTAITINIFY